MNYRIKAPAMAVAAMFTLTGCNLLDVDNPNSLVEESIQLEAAANGVANGSLRLTSEAIASVWEGPAVVADELYWTGSRDAWGQLDQGYIEDPQNEFTDAAFPSLGEAVWMGQNAVAILTEHVNNPDNAGVDSFVEDLGRAHMFNGLILMVTGEIQDDMTFSNKMEDGPPVGPENMYMVLDDAIDQFDQAIARFQEVGDADLELTATALRARAKMSRTIWDQLNPTATVGGALQFPEAAADAQAVLDEIGTGQWTYNLTYSAASASASMLGNVNNRGENQIDATLFSNTGPGSSGREDGAVVLLDPVDGTPDATVAAKITQFGENEYGDLTIVNAQLMHLILAEHALAGGGGSFTDHINAIRDLNGKTTDYAGGSDVEMLQHTRRVNTLFMGLRLQDMYRWGLTDPTWQDGSAAKANPGEMLPITIIEVRANCYLNGQGCGG